MLLDQLVQCERFRIQRAKRLHRRMHAICNSGYTGTWAELMYVNKGDFSAVSNTNVEATLLSGVNEQLVLPALFYLNPSSTRRTVRVVAKGVLGTTGSPTIIFQARLGTTGGSSSLTGASVGVTSAITGGATVTNKWWELDLDLTCSTPGIGTGANTIFGSGKVVSPTGFVSPFIYPLEPSTPDTATWTQTVDGSLNLFLNLSVTWSAANASNTITCKQLMCYGLN